MLPSFISEALATSRKTGKEIRIPVEDHDRAHDLVFKILDFFGEDLADFVKDKYGYHIRVTLFGTSQSLYIKW